MHNSKDVQAIRNAFKAYDGGPPREGETVSGLASVMLDFIKKDTRIRPRKNKLEGEEEKKMNIEPMESSRRMKIRKKNSTTLADAAAKEAYNAGFMAGQVAGRNDGHEEGYRKGVAAMEIATHSHKVYANSMVREPKVTTKDKPSLYFNYFFDIERDLMTRQTLLHCEIHRYTYGHECTKYAFNARLAFDYGARPAVSMEELIASLTYVTKQALVYVDAVTFVPDLVAFMCSPKNNNTLHNSSLQAVSQSHLITDLMHSIGYVGHEENMLQTTQQDIPF